MKYLSLLLSLTLATSAMAANFTASYTAAEIASQNGWKTGSFYTSFVLDSAVTIAAHQPDSGNLNGYYSPDSPRDWRLYQARNNGEFEITAREGLIIQSIALTYTVAKSGVLSLAAGSNIPEAQRIASGQSLLVQAPSITLYAGNTGAGGTGQVRISAFTIVYADTTVVVETFSEVDQKAACTTPTVWQGDYAEWDVYNTRRGTKDTLNGGVQASWSKKDGYFRTKNAEGGIKHLHFNWRQFVTDVEVELVLAIAAGENFQDTARMQSIATQALSKDQVYDKDLFCKENVQLSFSNISPGILGDKDRFLLGDLYITPYIYFLPENRYVSVEQTDATFDVSSVLLDNTEGEGEVNYAILSDGTDGCTINGSIVDLTSAQHSGDVEIEASWNSGKVTAHMTLNVTVASAKGEVWTETFSRCTRTDIKSISYVVGDDRIYDWNISNFTRREVDSVYGQQGIQIRHGGAIATNGVQEGGIKDIAFYWRATDCAQPVHFVLSVDGKSYNYKYTAAQSLGKTFLFRNGFSIKHNTAISIAVGAKEKTEQSPIIVGEIAIMPYILFTMPNRVDTLNLQDSTRYQFVPHLMDNTEGEGTITYSILSDETGMASIRFGSLRVDAAAPSGKVTIQAAWGDVTTTMSVYVIGSSTAIDTPSLSGEGRGEASKIIKDGRILIRHNDTYYDLLGNPVKP